MDETLEAQQPEVQEPIQQGADNTADPYSVDETALAGLAPEARVAFDNAVKQWRSKADEHVKSASEKAAEETSSKYRDYDEQKKYANALRQLTLNPEFVDWYRRTQMKQQQPQPEPQAASPEEYALAVQEAAAGNHQRLDAILAKKFQIMAAPTIREFQQQKIQQMQDREIDRLFKSHPDAEDLDQLGRQSDNDPSLLEWAIYDVVDKKGGTYEQAYQHARRIADQLDAKSKKAALGLVEGKKQSVTEKTSQQSKETDNFVEVGSAEEALRKTIEASMKGQKVTYVSKPRLARK